MKELEAMLKPLWGTEKWILEGWNKINADEKKIIQARVEHLFKDGLPFEVNHDKLLYIYAFSLMAQLEILGIQLPMRFEDKMLKPKFKEQMRAQLTDEIFHAIVFSKIVFMLCKPYGFPPASNEHIEKICNFVRSQDCVKIGMVVINLVCEGLVEEVFTIFYKNNIAPNLFKIILDDEHRHVSEADLYGEIGLPDRDLLVDTLQELEEIIISCFSLEPKYSIAVSSLLGPHATASFLSALHEKHTRQLKKINMVPSEKWDIFFQLIPAIYLKPYSEELVCEANNELYEIEMTPIRKILMTQMNSPGDPSMVGQFNIDVSALKFFEKKYPNETLTTLMMQTVSNALSTQPSFRNFLSYTKLYQSRGAYVSIIEKLPGCGDHIGTIYFKDCHEITNSELSKRIKRAKHIMVYCYKKREEVEKEHPHLKSQLDAMLYDIAHDNLYPYPVPGNYSIHLSNIGSYGYTQAISPLLKQSKMHILLLAIERKPVWCNNDQSFQAKDLLPVSLSADSRIFGGLLPIPNLLNNAFQTTFQKMKEQLNEPLINNVSPEINNYKERVDKISDDFLSKTTVFSRKKLLNHLINKGKDGTLNKACDILGGDLEQTLSEPSDYKDIADKVLLDYLEFDAEVAEKNENLTKRVNKMLSEDLELGYRMLTNLQTVWLDYVDIENLFNAANEKIAHSRLLKLSKFIPTIGVCTT